MSIGNKIREIRKAKNLKISEVEMKAGISEGNLSRIETGKQWPKEETLKAIANALECHISNFFSDSPNVGQQIPVITYAETEALQNTKQLHAIHQKITPYDSSHWIPANTDMPENTFALEIGDNSMFPEFHENDHVIIAPDLPPKPGDFVLATVNHEILFRKYRPRETNILGNTVFQLIPLNEDYPALRSDVVSITIIGTMLEHRRYRKK